MLPLIVAIVTGGCGVPLREPPDEVLRATIKNVAVEIDEASAAMTIITPARGPCDAMWRGTKVGSLVGLLFLVAGTPSGLIWGVITALKESPPPEVVDQAERNIVAALSGNLGEHLRRRTAHYLRASGKNISDRPGADAVVRLTVEEFGLRGYGLDNALWDNPHVSYFLHVRVRLEGALDRSVLYEQPFRFVSPRLPFFQWSPENASPAVKAMERGTDVLSEELVDEIFLLYRPKEKPVEP
jgi:hypothetical protein